MANWAITNYVVEGPEEVLHRIHEAILHHDIEASSSEDWEGNILNALGIEWERHVVHRRDDGKIDVSGYYMRGFIDVNSVDMTDDSLSFDAEEACGVTGFYEVLEKNLPVKVYWMTEESLMEVYQTNDVEGKYFPERYCVSACIDGEYYDDYFVSKKQMLDCINDITEGSVNTEQQIEEFNDSHEDEDNYIYFHEFDIVK